MSPRMHGSQVRIYLGSRDASGDLSSIEPSLSADTEESTTFASAGWKETDVGLPSWTAGFEGFYDSAVGGFGRSLEVPGVTFPALSIVDGDADAIGDVTGVFGPSVLSGVTKPIPVAGLVKVSGTLTGHGKSVPYGVLLHTLHQETVTASEASHDNTAASTNGGRYNLHVTAITGTWDIVVQESSDNGGTDPWATKATFAQVTVGGGPTSQSVEVAGTIKRYTRVTATRTSGNCTFLVTGARY